jgi:hypothetical protein
MDETKQYKTAGGLRAALETRLQARAQEEKTDLQRLRRQVAFDRFLARLFPKGPKGTYPWMLKGGYVMELRIRTARTTKDIDLTLYDGTRLAKDPRERRQQVRVMLQEAASTQLPDYFEFLIGEPREEMDGAPEGGSRYPVEARMDGRVFARFHVDIGIGDKVMEPLDEVKGRDWLGFGGIAPPVLPVISREQQFAEKLHAYSLPRLDRHDPSDPARSARRVETCGGHRSYVREEGNAHHSSIARGAACGMGTRFHRVSPGM